jgi:hypothetical protein
MTLPFWRDLAVIWLSLFCLISLIPPLVVLYYAVRGMNSFHNLSYRWVRRARGISSQAPQQAARLAIQVSEPLIQMQQRTKRVEAFLRSFR